MKAGLLQSQRGELVPHTDTKNDAGGIAYSVTDEHALAQMACTGTFSDTFYADARVQLERLLEVGNRVSLEFLAQTAVYSREKGFMKDAPAFLLAILVSREGGMPYAKRIFDRVIDDAGMLRKFVKALRSGVTGRKSMGTAIKKLCSAWILKASPYKLLTSNYGNKPSLGDIIKLCRPKANEPWQESALAHIIGKVNKPEHLPSIFTELDAWRLDTSLPVPDVPFLFLTSSTLTIEHWKQIVPRMTFAQVRQNLNYLQTQGVFEHKELVAAICKVLGDKEAMLRAKTMPYQIMITYLETKGNIPYDIEEALHVAMENALESVPVLPDDTVIGVDVSGSMRNHITSTNQTVASKVRNVDVAALMAVAYLRKNPRIKLIGFDDKLYELFKAINPRDTVFTNAQKIASIQGGATHCHLVMRYIMQFGIKTNNILIISDNESWSRPAYYNYQGTELMSLFNQYRVEQKNARMTLIDISPHNNTQGKENKNVTNIGGFSDNVFTLVDKVVNSAGKVSWVDDIKAWGL